MMTATPRYRKLEALDGLVTAEIGRVLLGLARQVPANQAIVEIGSYHGKSSCYLGEGSRCGLGAHVTCVDPWDLPGNPDTSQYPVDSPDARVQFAAQVASMGLQDRITAIQAFSADIASMWTGPIGLLFIDGDHSYRAVLADFRGWSGWVVKGGVVVFDDFDPDRDNKPVTRAVRKIMRKTAWGDWDTRTPRLAIGRRLR